MGSIKWGDIIFVLIAAAWPLWMGLLLFALVAMGKAGW